MKQNVRCTIEDVIHLLKEKYLKEGGEAFCADNDWHMYTAGDEWCLTTACCITALPDFDEETGEEIIPAFALGNKRSKKQGFS